MRDTLWTKNFIKITAATGFGAAGAIASGFALSFLVFDETGSTLASALIVAMQLVPSLIIPLLAAPWMDRFPRKPFLVGGDFVNALLYGLAGIYLHRFAFSYSGYLLFSLLLACLGSFDELAYNSLYPKLLPPGKEEKGYTVSAMLYPVLKVIMMPVAAVLFETFGVAKLLLLQSVLSLMAALMESTIQIKEEVRMEAEKSTLGIWWQDIKEAAGYLKKEKGLRSIYTYMAVTNGSAMGYGPILIAFFRTAPGFSIAMYSLFSVVEFAGRAIGGFVRYHFTIPEKRRFAFIFGVYQTYETMDVSLLWLPYPLMLVNRAICGFLGINSATIRQAAVQQYIPDRLRSRVNAFESMLITFAVAVISLAVGALGEVLDYRICMSLCGFTTMLVCWCTIFRERKSVKNILAYKQQN